MNGTEAIKKCEYDKERFGIDLTLPSLGHKDFYLSLLNRFQMYSSRDENVFWGEKLRQNNLRSSIHWMSLSLLKILLIIFMLIIVGTKYFTKNTTKN